LKSVSFAASFKEEEAGEDGREGDCDDGDQESTVQGIQFVAVG